MDIPLRKGDDDIFFLEEAIDFETNMGFDLFYLFHSRINCFFKFLL